MNEERMETARLIVGKKADILEDWMRAQRAGAILREELMSAEEFRRQSEELLDALAKAVSTGNYEDINTPEFEPLKDLLAEISTSWARQGFSPKEIATYILRLKGPLARILQSEYRTQPELLTREIIKADKLIDAIGIVIFETFIRGREETIRRQQEEILELSTPVIQIWKGALVVPLIDIMDSARTQVVTKNLLEEIVRTNAQVVILDISGVPTVDTLTAQHLLKTVAASRLMGSQCIVSGIRPGIAETIVNLGIDLSDVKTSANLSGALKDALRMLNLDVVERKGL